MDISLYEGLKHLDRKQRDCDRAPSKDYQTSKEGGCMGT